MIICLESSVLGGYLSNEVPGLVTGLLHLAGVKQPIRLELVGNFSRDIAGCRVDFHNPLPEGDVERAAAVSPQQAGFTGVMTASYRAIKLPRRRRNGAAASPLPDPQGLKNLLFFEWFNQQGQRILIQSWHLQLRVTAPRWQMSAAEESALLRQSRARRKHFLLTMRRGKSGPDALYAPGLADPFEPQALSGNPFDTVDMPDKPPPSVNELKDEAVQDPTARSTALAQELRRFERLLVFNNDMRSRPAVVKLLSTVADLAAHLVHVLRQFSDIGVSAPEKDRWQFLIVDLEQSLPLFGAALNATDKLVAHVPDHTDRQWLASVQASLLNIELRMRELLTLLR